MEITLRNNERSRFPFFKEIIEYNHDYILEFTSKVDFDSYIILMNLYLYTCKFMYMNNIPLTKKDIYNNMQYLFKNPDFRQQLIDTFNPEKVLSQIQLQI